jgi:hypothetical protein
MTDANEIRAPSNRYYAIVETLIEPCRTPIYTTIVKNANGETIAIFNKRTASRWFVKTGKEYLYVNCSIRSSHGYETIGVNDHDARCVFFEPIRQKSIFVARNMHVDEQSWIGVSHAYDGYTEALLFLDLSAIGVDESIETIKPLTISYTAFPTVEQHIMRCENDIHCFLEERNDEAATIRYAISSGTIVVQKNRYYRVLQNHAFLDDETKFGSSADSADECVKDKRAIYTSGNDGEFFAANEETIFFEVQKTGSLEVVARHFSKCVSMPKDEFDAQFQMIDGDSDTVYYPKNLSLFFPLISTLDWKE